jgi:hypothetical protein
MKLQERLGGLDRSALDLRRTRRRRLAKENAEHQPPPQEGQELTRHLVRVALADQAGGLRPRQEVDQLEAGRIASGRFEHLCDLRRALCLGNRQAMHRDHLGMRDLAEHRGPEGVQGLDQRVAALRRRQVASQPDLRTASSDARDQHRPLVAEMRIDVALRDLGPGRDLQRAGPGVALFHEETDRGIEDALGHGAQGFAIGGIGLEARLHTANCLLRWYQIVPYSPGRLVPNSTRLRLTIRRLDR